MEYGETSPSPFRRRWDVFLNFSGTDTRYGFTGHLHKALREKGFDVYLDSEELRAGEEIFPAILRAIEQSRIAIIVFSKSYAASRWLLDELVNILQCKQTRGLIVLPIFYDVDPSEVRHQAASFGEAMAKHETLFKDNKEKLQTWTQALSEAANLTGFVLENRYEYELIEDIVKDVSIILYRPRPHNSDYLVGLEARISAVTSLLLNGHAEDICMVGICGLGGIGKTTIAEALFDSIADQFEHACFLANTRDQRQGLVPIQEKLLDLVGENDIKLNNIHEGCFMIKRRLHLKKVLLILDDIDNLEQIQALAGGRDWFGFGSVIIITTRDKQVLAAHGVKKTYEVTALNHDEAVELFAWNAFRRKAPDADYTEISNRVVHYAKGLPLALKVFGSSLYRRSFTEWKSRVDKFERFPDGEVLNLLKISYDALEDNVKEIFLDIACFFMGERVEYVVKILEACGSIPIIGIDVLIDQSLITVDEYNRVGMHNLVRDMAREIVKQESLLEPGKRSRLWHHEDVLEVLTENTGSAIIQGILLDLPDKYVVPLSHTPFQMMKNLRVLIVQNLQSFGISQYLPNNLRALPRMEYVSSLLPSRTFAVFNPSGNCIQLQEPLKRRTLRWKKITQIGTEKCSRVCLYKKGMKIHDFSFINSAFLDSELASEEVDDALDISKEETLTSINHPIPKSYETQTETESKGKGVLVYSSDEAERTHIQVPEKSANEEFIQIKDNMEAFYGSIEAEHSALPLLQEALNTRPSEETQKKLQSLRDLMLKKFSVLLHPGRYGHMKNVLDYLLSLSPEEGISLRMKSAMLKLSTSFSQWSLDYNDASLELESATAIMSNAEKLQEDLETNLKEFRDAETFQKLVHDRLADLEKRKGEIEEQINPIKAMLRLSTSLSQWSSDSNYASLQLESATAILSNAEKWQEDVETDIKEFMEVETFYSVVCSRLAFLEVRKRELEEQIDVIKADIADLKLAWDEVEHRKKKVFENGRMIKVQADDLRKTLPRIRAEQELARATQADIESKQGGK